MANNNNNEMELLRQFAHEVGNPLNSLIGFSNMIKGSGGTEPTCEQIHDYADRINKAAKRLAEVCERVLDESIKGHKVVRKVPLEFDNFCEEIVDTFAYDAEEKGVNLSYDIDDDFPVLETDPVLLYEIMSNLIGNAIKFTPKGGNVAVKGTMNRKNEALLLVVQDSGKGMPTTIINAIKKGEGVTTSFAHTNRKGWGIGMQTVLEKTTQLGGELVIERAMNGGTVVCVKFPWDQSIAA